MFLAKNELGIEEFAPGPVGPGQVRLRTSYSLISAGTEGIVLHGHFDQGTHWADWVRYPFRPGYCAVGRVEEAGPGVTGLAAGDLVAVRAGHASEHVIPAGSCTPVPPGIGPQQACWFGLAKIALVGARAAACQLGYSVAVVGAGPIGQMSVRWAVAAGARFVVAVDTRDARQGGDQPEHWPGVMAPTSSALRSTHSLVRMRLRVAHPRPSHRR